MYDLGDVSSCKFNLLYGTKVYKLLVLKPAVCEHYCLCWCEHGVLPFIWWFEGNVGFYISWHSVLYHQFTESKKLDRTTFLRRWGNIAMSIKDLSSDLVLCFSTFIFMGLLPGPRLRFRVGTSGCFVISFLLIHLHEPVPKRKEGGSCGRHSSIAVECLPSMCEYMGLNVPGTVKEK